VEELGMVITSMGTRNRSENGHTAWDASYDAPNQYGYITYLFRGTTVLVELWLPHIFDVRFHDDKFLQGGIVSPIPNPQPGGPGYLF
jgi:hypothetical protein